MVTQIARAAEDLNRSTDSQQLLTSQCSVGSANTHPWGSRNKEVQDHTTAAVEGNGGRKARQRGPTTN